jgi:hypothetical protein
MTETQQRFLRVIAERIPADQVVELHLFPSIRQSGVETGVAVVAVESVAPNDAVDELPAAGDAEASSEAAPAPDDQMGAESGDDANLPLDADESVQTETADRRAPRLIVYSAHFRLTLKGPDRGKWEVDVTAEADAPLDAVDAVVRGVQRRAGEAVDAERLSGDAFRAALLAVV